MFTGTPEELAENVRQAKVLLEEIAERLNRLDKLAPGGTWGEVGSLGGAVVHRGSGWVVDERH